MDKRTAQTDHSFLGAGWAFPPAFDNANHQTRLSGGVANINQSIDVLLHTAPGSRSMLPGYGCNLPDFLFRRFDATLEGEIIQMVKTALLNFEPRIVVEQVAVAQRQLEACIDIVISYQIKLTNTRHNHVFPYALIEASNLATGR